MRPYWEKYVTFDTRALLWVLDGSDHARLEEAAAALRSLLEREFRLRDMPLLVLVNKCELGGLSTAEVQRALQLSGESRQFHVQPCSAATGQGVSEGLRWLSSTLTATLR